ncbi:MAG: gamma carbonic anhydrase family protein [Candidatus Sericytochromatia bacterium]|nr:gamma carbonic anhydrase family protein [Candidatus Sericytochromatia bacterium]
MAHSDAFELTDEVIIDETAFVAPNATILGRVSIGPAASVWFGVVIRAEQERVVIGPRSNVQDGAVVHVDEGFPVTIGADVTIGHRAVVHGASIGDGSLVGIGAILLNGCRIGEGSIVAAGALVPEGKAYPPGVLLVGVPARIARDLKPEEVARIRAGSEHYVAYGAAYARRLGDLL